MYLLQSDVAEAILESDQWMEAMKCEFPNAAHGIRDTPLRLLIKMFPDLAKKVFDQCTETNIQQVRLKIMRSPFKIFESCFFFHFCNSS